MVASCLASIAGRWSPATTMLARTSTRDVSAAQADRVVIISGLKNVIRSPVEIDEYGPSSTNRHQSRRPCPVKPLAMVGSAMPMSMEADASR